MTTPNRPSLVVRGVGAPDGWAAQARRWSPKARLTALSAIGTSAVFVGLFYAWFVSQNRYVVFLYFHRGNRPFDATTASRYWMAGLVAAGIVALLYWLLNGLIGWAARRQHRVYAPPSAWQVWLAAAPMVGVGVVVVVTKLGRPALTLENTVACLAAVLIGLALALWPGALAARAPAELLWLFGYGLGLAPILLLFRAVELPGAVWGGPLAHYAVAGAGVAASALGLGALTWVRAARRQTVLPPAQVGLAGLSVSYLLLPLAHYWVLTPPTYHYISVASNFFAGSVWVQLITWAVASALCWAAAAWHTHVQSGSPGVLRAPALVTQRLVGAQIGSRWFWGGGLLMLAGFASVGVGMVSDQARWMAPDLYPDSVHWSNVEWAGQLGGESPAVAVQGNLAYLAVGSRLVVLDVSNPAAPQLKGQVTLPGIILGVAVSGGYAYLADGGSGLQVVNVANPATPFVTGSADTPDIAYRVVVAGNAAFLADGSAGLLVINIANPAAPTEVGAYDTPGYAMGIALAGNTAYVADSYGRTVRIINVANPAAPTEVGFYQPSLGYAEPDDVAISGSYIYVAERDATLWVVNIANPAAPVEVTSYPSTALRVTLAGDIAYVANGYNGDLLAINISNPAALTLAGQYLAPDTVQGIAISGNHAFLAVGGYGLQIINIANPAALNRTGAYETVGRPQGIAIAGHYAYLAEANVGLRIVDIANPLAPVDVGAYNTPDTAIGVAVAGNHAYIADGSDGLRVIDISNPATPIEEGFYDTPGYATGVAVAGNTAYVADGAGSGLRVIDVSNPAAPAEVGHYVTPGDAIGVAVASHYAYVVAGHVYGLRVMDVSNPAAPIEVGSYLTSGEALAVAVTGNYAYVADGTGGLRVLSIAEPAFPTETGFSETPDFAEGVAVAGNNAYVADYSSGLRVVNIADPATPSEVGFYDTPGIANGVAVAGNYVYVADAMGGLVVLRPTTPHLFGTLTYLSAATLNYIRYFPGPNEVEPNNTAAQANGPLQSGVNYHGHQNDFKDYFAFTMPNNGHIHIVVSNIALKPAQLLLYHQSVADRIMCVTKADPLVIDVDGQSGSYYVEIFTQDPNPNITASYNLNVIYSAVSLALRNIWPSHPADICT